MAYTQVSLGYYITANTLPYGSIWIMLFINAPCRSYVSFILKYYDFSGSFIGFALYDLVKALQLFDCKCICVCLVILSSCYLLSKYKDS